MADSLGSSPTEARRFIMLQALRVRPISTIAVALRAVLAAVQAEFFMTVSLCTIWLLGDICLTPFSVGR